MTRVASGVTVGLCTYIHMCVHIYMFTHILKTRESLDLLLPKTK